MFTQTSLPIRHASLPLSVEAEEGVASGRYARFLWTGLGFGVLMLIGISGCALIPISSRASAKSSRLVPEVATFLPDMSSLSPVQENQEQLLFVPSVSAMAARKSNFQKAAADPASGKGNKALRAAALPGLNQRKERPSIAAMRMSGAGGQPLSRRAALRAVAGAAAAAHVLAHTASPAFAMAGEGTMSQEEVIRVAIEAEKNEQVKGAVEWIALKGMTEKQFTGKTSNGYPYDNKAKGTYVGALSGARIFESSAKYDSGTGWPTFTEAVPGSVFERNDASDTSNAYASGYLVFGYWGVPLGNIRTEVLDAKSGTRLGYVYTDRQSPTGKGYVVNAAALTFVPADSKDPVLFPP